MHHNQATSSADVCSQRRVNRPFSDARLHGSHKVAAEARSTYQTFCPQLYLHSRLVEKHNLSTGPRLPLYQRHLLTFIPAYEPDRLEMSHLHVAFALGTCFSDLY